MRCVTSPTRRRQAEWLNRLLLREAWRNLLDSRKACAHRMGAVDSETTQGREGFGLCTDHVIHTGTGWRLFLTNLREVYSGPWTSSSSNSLNSTPTTAPR